MGVLGGVVSVMVVDEVKEEERIKVMVIMGVFIFISFIISMVIGFGVVVFLGGVKWFFLFMVILILLSLLMFLKVKDVFKIFY